jgi:hypothetical protein
MENKVFRKLVRKWRHDAAAFRIARDACDEDEDEWFLNDESARIYDQHADELYVAIDAQKKGRSPTPTVSEEVPPIVDEVPF